MLDRYFIGSARRISPEAPVPVVTVKKETHNLGGAGNVANNIAHLGANSWLCGIVGTDGNGKIIHSLMKQNKIMDCLINLDVQTITKTRIMGDKQQIVRVDVEEEIPESMIPLETIKKRISSVLEKVHAVIISDYKKGMCTEEICTFVISNALQKNIPVIIDPKGTNWKKYQHATLVTPNFKEFSEILRTEIENTDDAIQKYGPYIRKKFSLKNLLITRSEKGMTLITSDDAITISTEAKEIFDVSGAGDTVIATIATCLAAHYTLEDALRISNKAAGIVVCKSGTVPIEIQELNQSLQQIHNQKHISLPVLKTKIIEARKKGKKIVFTNGCFDILHKGHIKILRESKDQGDILIVGLNSDSSVRKLKGKTRPLNTESDRAEILSAIEYVDYVTIFSEQTPLNLIKHIKPDVLVKGGDYKPEEIVGREFAGATVVVPFEEGYSTTATIKKMNT